MNHQITEEDLVHIFSYQNRVEKRQNLLFQFFYRGLLFLIFAVFVYVVINFNAVSATLVFWYKGNFTTQTTNPESISIVAPGVPTLESERWAAPTVLNNHISIPVLDINAPVTFGVNNTAKEVAASLENGVIQINGTSLPGQTGNIYITGHSSNYVWVKGDYNSIFAILDKLVVGDLVYINYNGATYEYQIFNREIVLPNDTSMLKSTNDSRLTLVTCWPVGTSLKRLVLLANQIQPDPKNNTVPNTPANFQSLPSGR